MSITPTTTRAAIAVAIAGITASLLTGCFGNPGNVNQAVEDAIESATGGDVSLDGDLPADFPTSVPLIEGDVNVAAGAGGSEGWVVVITPSASDDPVGEAASALEAAGFTADPKVTGEGAALYSNGEYTVLIVGKGTAVSYTVTPEQ
ncbi:hypothetical protein [Agromyces sp. Soil535]|uniref:hypothetical protein n=1 Tax=Agromyces sp. Soil535 TaxID=1736390 RepID=UPI0006F26B56|nr:hypothetical protein [Agromyces sp. Soil535]KRE21606.1 hypothetical protein ASG80_13410 [Agromyces sp. Soil535]